MFKNLFDCLSGKTIVNNYSTVTNKVDETVKGNFEYIVRVSHVGIKYDVTVKVFDLNEDVLWRCPECGQKLTLPKLPKLTSKVVFDETRTNHDRPMLEYCYGNGHSASIKKVLYYKEK